jgi:hypothetical protein
MNKLIATLLAGAFAVFSTAAVAQSTAPAPAPADKAKRPPLDLKTQQDLSRNSPNPADQKSAVEQSKMGPKPTKPNTKDPATFKAAQDLSRDGGTNPVEAKANVDASKAASTKRQRLPNVKDLTPQERAALLKQLQEQSKP